MPVDDGFMQHGLTNDPEPDAALMQRYGMGDVIAFDELYYRHKDALYRYLLRQLGPQHAAKLFQMCWLNMVNVRRGYRASAKFTVFLYTVAHRALIDHYRRHDKRVMASYADDSMLVDENDTDPSGKQDPLSIVLGEDRTLRLSRFVETLNALPAPQREAFLLHTESGLSIADLAVATGATAELVQRRLRAATQQLCGSRANSQTECETLVAELYRAGEFSPFPEQLDDVILVAARRDVRGSSRRAPQSMRAMWRMPLATAAVFVLCIGLFTLLRSQDFAQVELKPMASLLLPAERAIPVAKILSAPAPRHATSDEWLQAIARLRRDQQLQRADDELKLFKRQYPMVSDEDIARKLAE